jgi:DNA topoisomerase-1
LLVLSNGMPRARAPRRRPPVVVDPVESADEAGLIYVNEHDAGIRRRRAGRSFTYVDARGQRVEDPATLARIRTLAIPPAWTDVWICGSPRGHVQAVGRDARHRKQYRYHPRWCEVRDAAKYARMLAFARVLPAIRARVAGDLARRGLPREKVLAAAVRLLELTLIRVGNAEYARHNGSFGLTTLRDRHVRVHGAVVAFHFRGKSGKPHAVDVTDAALARIVRRCRALPGPNLFQYVDARGRRQPITAGDVNDYIRDAAGADFSAKDFRTWAGTVLAALALADAVPATSRRQAARIVATAVATVAQRLGNTPAVCRKGYVHPGVIDAYLDGITLRAVRGAARPAVADGLAVEEARVLALLEARVARAPATRAA